MVGNQSYAGDNSYFPKALISKIKSKEKNSEKFPNISVENEPLHTTAAKKKKPSPKIGGNSTNEKKSPKFSFVEKKSPELNNARRSTVEISKEVLKIYVEKNEEEEEYETQRIPVVYFFNSIDKLDSKNYNFKNHIPPTIQIIFIYSQTFVKVIVLLLC
jgi:hypothetical protein